MIYIASPFTHKCHSIEDDRYEAAKDYATYLLNKGRPAFSPIAYGYQFDRATDFESWRMLNDVMIAKCDEFHILQIEGYEQSRGVAHELELARSLDKPLWAVTPVFDGYMIQRFI